MTDVIPGDTVVVKIHNGNRQAVYRPLLVTHVVNKLTMNKIQPVVSGELFLHAEEDRNYEWIMRTTFYRPDKDRRTLYVKDLFEGDLVGNWTTLKDVRRKIVSSNGTGPKAGAA